MPDFASPMPTPAPLLMRLLACSASAALHAGEYIRQVLRSGQLGIVVKGHNDLQTQADRGAQRLIIGSLRAAFPGLTVIGEEDEEPLAAPLSPEEIAHPLGEVLDQCRLFPPSLANVRLEDLTVWVDPLDGTSDFAENQPDSVTVLVGVALGGRALAGVVHRPCSGCRRLAWGLSGLGVFGLPAPVGSAPPPGCVVTTTRSHGGPVVEAAVAACAPTQVVRVGGCGHKVLLLLERRAHVYAFASPGCNKWDTCAPEALLTAAGGHLTDLRGQRLHYGPGAVRRNTGGILAALSPEDHARCLGAMPPEVLAELSS